MCGIVAVLARPSGRTPADPDAVVAEAAAVAAALADGPPAEVVRHGSGRLEEAAARLRAMDAELRGPVGLRAMLGRPDTLDRFEEVFGRLEAALTAIEGALDSVAVELDPAAQEAVSSALVRLKDAWWALARDRVGCGRRVAGLLGGRSLAGTANLDGWWAIAVALSSLDRLEVRGRDSAGVHVLVSGVGIDASDPELAARSGDVLYPNGSVRVSDGAVGFVYKAAAEIGELGDNVRCISTTLQADALLARLIEDPAARVVVVGHTRWASVGIISEPNAHPVDSEEIGRLATPYVIAALNGDVDNHMELRQEESLSLPAGVTTDAKVIPALIARRVGDGLPVGDAFLQTVPRFEGSVAIAASAAATPDQVYLALCGSGQSLYIGLADDAFVVASEPYGLVEETDRYIRMDGDTTQGEVVVLERSGAGTLAGVTRCRYAGADRPLGEADVAAAEITTRDVDRRGFDHFLLKEITEAPDSFRKTLRGRITARPDGLLAARVGDDVIPTQLAAALASGDIRRVVVVGQGTAAVAGQAVAAALRDCLDGMVVQAMPATELSGFGLADDMSDCLV
ncbi:MAG TPA: glucosamine-6-phosphate synthase, partial [Acidimicrobiales bacterium]|nr:glucosamine-6-phosphate synthase [Acidimicrobiales bacterium]